jgi:predicted ATP-grasp superfamily ATP-dependent carboligase
VKRYALRSEDSASRLNRATVDEAVFRRIARSADFTLVIAPEFDGLLEERCRWAVAEGSRLLGPSPDAVRLTADKLQLAEHLRRHDVPTPLTTRCVDDDPPWHYPVICKPRFGAGSQHTLRVQNREGYIDFQERIRGETSSLRKCVVQPLIPGRPASVTFLATDGEASAKPHAAGRNERFALPACEQYLSGDGRFCYLGGRVPLEPALQNRAQDLARRAAQAVEGLTGYFGVDLVLGESANGSDDVVIEINPRLTTSYVGLRQLTPGNLMQTLLDLVLGRCPEPLQWYDKRVRFHPDGRID